MKLGAIMVMQNIRAMVGRHEAKFASQDNKGDVLVTGTTCDINTRIVSLYARAAMRYLPMGERVRTLELARIEVSPRYRGRGFFRYILKGMEDLADLTNRTVYIESVVNDDLWHSLIERRTGYKVFPDSTSGWPNSLYRLPMSVQEAAKG